MNEQDKQLLLKDLSARLPYGVKLAFRGNININIYTCKGFDSVITDEGVREEYCITGRGFVPIESIKPYLRPMSSMTNEEIKSMPKPFKLQPNGCISSYDVDYALEVVHYEAAELTDWLNAHHFDYRGLIPKGLALPAPEGMYDNIKTE